MPAPGPGSEWGKVSQGICAAAVSVETGVFGRALLFEVDKRLPGALVSQVLARICIARRALKLQDHAVSIS